MPLGATPDRWIIVVTFTDGCRRLLLVVLGVDDAAAGIGAACLVTMVYFTLVYSFAGGPFIERPIRWDLPRR